MCAFASAIYMQMEHGANETTTARIGPKKCVFSGMKALLIEVERAHARNGVVIDCARLRRSLRMFYEDDDSRVMRGICCISDDDVRCSCGMSDVRQSHEWGGQTDSQ